MKKYQIPIVTILLFISTAGISFAQDSTVHKNSFQINFGVSPDSYRYSQASTSSLYYEVSFDYYIGKYTYVGAYLGTQSREGEFSSLHPYDPKQIRKTIGYSRRYIPTGLRAGVNITDVFSQQLNIIKQPEKWDVYLQTYIGLTVSSEKFTPVIAEGDIIEWSNFEGEEDMKYIAGIVAGIKYYPIKNLGVFVEGGLGPVGRYSVGLSHRFLKNN